MTYPSSLPSFVGDLPEPSPLRAAIEDAYLANETACAQALLRSVPLSEEARGRIAVRAHDLVAQVRATGERSGSLGAFLHEYRLSDHEGVVLMCLAEALLRIPDAETADRLIRDKLSEADWHAHLGKSESVFVNASTMALILTGRVINVTGRERKDPAALFGRLVARLGEPIVRQAMTQAMRILGQQFVMGRTIDEALARARRSEFRAYRFSYDMLGEAALSAADADAYFQIYADAIARVAATADGKGPIAGPGISVKLSALHPRYEIAQRGRVMAELVPRLVDLAGRAKKGGIGLCVDAEEADRLDLSLDVIEAVSADRALSGWDGFGVAVQAYLKRAPRVIDWLADLAERHGRRFMVRLVKGAYWDSEIKRAQERGLPGYPVFTRKATTDVSYLACAAALLKSPGAFFPQFATHNAHTVAAVLELAGGRRDFEFQRLHGMGEILYAVVSGKKGMGYPCRTYAPVGGHEDLLAYLVRRLLENGANTSFVNRIGDPRVSIESIVADPIDRLAKRKAVPHPRVPLPGRLFEDRVNSKGINLDDPKVLRSLAQEMASVRMDWRAAPIVDGESLETGVEIPRLDPADGRRVVGTAFFAGAAQIERALASASAAAADWDRVPATRRAECLETAADLLEVRMAEFMAVAVREAGKTLPDAAAEVREAVDFCRYYALRAREEFSVPQVLSGPTGESNRISLHGRGVFVCISPWNFPLAIFMGQVAAALAAGNAVVAKPAEQTPLMAALAVRLLHEVGIPPNVLHLLPGDGPGVGEPLVRDPRVAGVAFTGSVAVARRINRQLAAKDGPIVPLIAETGGQNAMIVDSSALPEQVVADAVTSAFRSAGQRCSALRVLMAQEDIADHILGMLAGAVVELRIGDPGLLDTDIGPVIDPAALRALERHVIRMEGEARRICPAVLPGECRFGTFLAPQAFEISGLNALKGEVFGPILHVVRFERSHVDDVIAAVNATGYGLTLGIHSRVGGTARHISERLRVGNTYVNRSMIGSMVGVQPFGGEGLSGTGPKAGGPRYLHRFATERTVSIDLAATGGNAELLALDDDED